MTKDEVAKIVQQLKGSNTSSFVIVPTNREVNTFKVIGRDGYREKGEENVVYQNSVVTILHKLGFNVEIGLFKLEDVYRNVPSGVWSKVADVIYFESNQNLGRIKLLGYLPNDSEYRKVNKIRELVGNIWKEKHSKLAKIAKVSRKNLGYTDEEWHLFCTQGGTRLVTETGIQRESTEDAFVNAKEMFLKHESVLSDEDITQEARAIVEDMFNKLTRVRTEPEKALFAGLKEVGRKVNREANGTVLYYVEQVLNNALHDRTRFGKKLQEAKEFKEKLSKYDAVKRIKPVVVSNKPYVLVEGDLDKIHYAIGDGYQAVTKRVSKARGVTLISEDEGYKQYRVTLNAFLDISNNSEFRDEYVKYDEGEWSKVYVSGTKSSLTITDAFASEVDSNGECSILKYNANRTATNGLGIPLPFWQIDILEQHATSDYADDMYDDILEIEAKLDKRKYPYSKIQLFKREYAIRNGNTEKLAEYKRLAKIINDESKRLEPEVVKAVNAEFGKNYTKISDIEDLDFGFDSGFSYIEYKNEGRKSEVYLYQDQNGDDIISPERAVTFIPRVQSLTVKGFIGRKFIPEINKELPSDAQLLYYGRLD